MEQNSFSENNIKHFIDDLFVPIQLQTGLDHLIEYLKNKHQKWKYGVNIKH